MNIPEESKEAEAVKGARSSPKRVFGIRLSDIRLTITREIIQNAAEERKPQSNVSGEDLRDVGFGVHVSLHSAHLGDESHSMRRIQL